MPRDIMAERNVVEIYDGKCGETHEFFYRDPTVKEMEAYNAQCFTRKRNKVTNHQVATRLKFGKKVLTGFAKGTLAANGKLMASDPGRYCRRQGVGRRIYGHLAEIRPGRHRRRKKR